jgi:hypothetical protein
LFFALCFSPLVQVQQPSVRIFAEAIARLINPAIRVPNALRITEPFGIAGSDWQRFIVTDAPGNDWLGIIVTVVAPCSSL